MTPGPNHADEALRAEISRAFSHLRPRMTEHARQDADLDPTSRVGEFSDADLEQLLNAYEALFREALDGSGRQTRELIFDTALPPVLELGQTALDMARSNAISAVMLAHRLLPLVAPEQREAAARWLAGFHGDYAHDLLGRVVAIETERP